MTASEPPANWGANSRGEMTWCAEWKRAWPPQPDLKDKVADLMINVKTAASWAASTRKKPMSRCVTPPAYSPLLRLTVE